MRKLQTPLNLQQFNTIRQAPTGGYYVFEHLLFDTGVYLAAGAAGAVIPYFGNVARGGDTTLTNWPNSGQLPKPHKFHGLYLFATPLVETSMAAGVTAAGRVSDVEKVWRTSRAVIDFDLSATGRRRPPVPLASVGSLPGVRASIAPGTAAAQNPLQQLEQIGNGEGMPFDLPLDEGETFGLTIRLRPDVATPITADMPIQISVYGWYYMSAG
jgi:hypothetical protein